MGSPGWRRGIRSARASRPRADREDPSVHYAPFAMKMVRVIASPRGPRSNGLGLSARKSSATVWMEHHTIRWWVGELRSAVPLAKRGQERELDTSSDKRRSPLKKGAGARMTGWRTVANPATSERRSVGKRGALQLSRGHLGGLNVPAMNRASEASSSCALAGHWLLTAGGTAA